MPLPGALLAFVSRPRSSSSSSNIHGTRGPQENKSQRYNMTNYFLARSTPRGISLSDLGIGRQPVAYLPMPPPSYATNPSTRPPSYTGVPPRNAASNNLRPHISLQTNVRPRPPPSQPSLRRRCGDFWRTLSRSDCFPLLLILMWLAAAIAWFAAVNHGVAYFNKYEAQRLAESKTGCGSCA